MKHTSMVTKGRRRNGPNRKWTQTEIVKLLQFCKDNRDFEKPTARMFYNRYIDEYKINVANWSLVRLKMRNLRSNYKRAREWVQGPGAEATSEGKSVGDILIRICPYYADLEDIFGARDYLKQTAALTSEKILYGENSSPSFDGNTIYLNENGFLDAAHEDDALQHDTLKEDTSTNSATPQRCAYSMTSFTDAQSQTIELRKLKMNEELSFKQKQLEFEKEKLAFEKDKLEKTLKFEEYKFVRELQMKEKELQSREKLKLLELGVKERIEMRELELKYKNN